MKDLKEKLINKMKSLSEPYEVEMYSRSLLNALEAM